MCGRRRTSHMFKSQDLDGNGIGYSVIKKFPKIFKIFSDREHCYTIWLEIPS